MRIDQNRQSVVTARDTLVEADQAYYTKSQRAVLFCFDWTNICESIMRLHLQTRAEEAVGVCFHPFHLPFTAPPAEFLISKCAV